MSRSPGARRALIWSFVNAALGKLGGLLIGIIIARVLGPEEFGTYAVALIALMAVLSFNELGVSLAIVRWPQDPRQIAPTVASISVGVSLLIFVAGVWVAPTFAAAMGDADAAPVIQVMLLGVPLNGLVAVAAAILQREFQQGKRTIADQVNTWLGAGISVALALLGFGAMSLAIGRIAASVVFAIMLLSFCPLPLRFGWDRAYVRPLLRFGIPLAAASIVVFAVGYADQLIVGGVLGAQALGFYLLAFNLAGWPVAMLSHPVRAVAPSVFARIQDSPPRLDEVFRAGMRLLLCAAVPVCTSIAAAALPIVTFVYGTEWAGASLALQWLALHAAIRIAFELSYDFLVVRQRSAMLMWIQVGWLALLIPACVIGARLGGIEGVSIAQVAVAGVVLCAGYGWALVRSGVHGGRLIRASAVPLSAGVVAGAATAWCAALADSDVAASLAAAAIACVVALLCLALSRTSVATLREARKVEE